MTTQVAITGLGAVSALGMGTNAIWDRAMAGPEDTIQEIRYFSTMEERCRIAATVYLPEIEPPWPEAVLSRSDQFALIAAEEAVQQSALNKAQVRKAGCFFGAGTGGLHVTEAHFENLLGSGEEPDYRDFLLHNGDVSAQCVAKRFSLEGPVRSVMTACSSSALALAEAVEQIRLGFLDIALAGGADAITRLTQCGFNSLSATDPQPCRPFDANRNGLNLGECGAFLVLESEAHARQRGGSILAWIKGYGLSCDAHHMTAPPSDGHGARRAMQTALFNAGLEPESIQLINAHGTATPLNDEAETAAICSLFSPRRQPLYVTATKGVTGHCLGAAGAIEAVLTCLSLQRQQIPPTVRNRHSLLNPPFYLVTEPQRDAKFTHALSSSFAFGGNNAAIVFAAP